VLRLKAGSIGHAADIAALAAWLIRLPEHADRLAKRWPKGERQ